MNPAQQALWEKILHFELNDPQSAFPFVQRLALENGWKLDFAFRAIQSEDKIGTMLPCNVLVIEHAPGQVEVAAVDPVASMTAVKNPKLATIAGEVRDLLKQVVSGL